MDAQIVNILKAKLDAVEALEFTMRTRVNDGQITSAESALAFVKTWAEAMDAMVPAEAETLTSVVPLKAPLHASHPNAVHYREDFSGPLTACERDVQNSAHILYTDDAAGVTCEACRVILGH